ncbi:uncharacterized protein TRAVEDRAFT_126961 [Trametes versicolor FP-101664 SS1]|uniref:uncharacterized protein n=1 Tax=Trametes versicolor (strain FP-101664) TaxID=717944 RepID=UPI0004622EC4|nr:uncharacterized protein TRAVEDRAFT_126961 [Trametes versicolor FP-101664 SS1]EIW56716.1 hypothetical protein TRAVEDRAFT_126961 [Trametes versicolor FP-101664 SS1]
MSSTNFGHIFQVAQQDASHYGAAPVNLKDISEADARKLISEEHKALGYRPPPGSLASQAQALVARHETSHAEDHGLTLDEEQIREAALLDAERIKKERESTLLDLNSVGAAEAKKLMSDEHKALGYRPPPGSLAAEAHAAAAKHPDASANVDSTTLVKAAFEDATHIASSNGGTQHIDVQNMGAAEARKLMSEEHRALGYRPPPGSLAAMAQAAAAKHPDANAGVNSAALAQAALEDAKRIAAERSSNGSASSHSSASSPDPTAQLNLNTISAPEARTLQSEEHKLLGHRPPAGSVAAQAQSVVDQRAQVPVTKELAASLESQEHKVLGHRPESGTIASTAQSLADKNAQDGGDRTLGDVGL